MERVTLRAKCAGVAQKWREQYFVNKCWGTTQRGSSRDVYEKLIELGPSPTSVQIADVIGNDSWTHVRCDECEQPQERVIRLGQRPDYDVSTIYICDECLNRAIELLHKPGVIACPE